MSEVRKKVLLSKATCLVTGLEGDEPVKKEIEVLGRFKTKAGFKKAVKSQLGLSAIYFYGEPNADEILYALPIAEFVKAADAYNKRLENAVDNAIKEGGEK